MWNSETWWGELFNTPELWAFVEIWWRNFDFQGEGLIYRALNTLNREKAVLPGPFDKKSIGRKRCRVTGRAWVHRDCETPRKLAGEKPWQWEIRRTLKFKTFEHPWTGVTFNSRESLWFDTQDSNFFTTQKFVDKGAATSKRQLIITFKVWKNKSRNKCLFFALLTFFDFWNWHSPRPLFQPWIECRHASSRGFEGVEFGTFLSSFWRPRLLSRRFFRPLTLLLQCHRAGGFIMTKEKLLKTLFWKARGPCIVLAPKINNFPWHFEA